MDTGTNTDVRTAPGVSLRSSTMGAATRPTPASPGRRSVLLGAAGAGAVLLSGCTLNNPFEEERTPAARAVRDLAPDVGTAVQVVALITAAQTELDTLLTGHPALRSRLGGLAAAYQAYTAALLGAVPPGVDATGAPTGSPSGAATTAPSTAPTTAPTAAGAKAAARRTAATLHDRLAGFALRAESGSFARLLGSMAAGLSQQLVVLDR